MFVMFPAIEPVVDPAPTDTVPAEIVVPPEYVLAADSVRVCALFSDNDPTPVMAPERV